MTGIVEAIDDSVRGAAGVSALPDGHEVFRNRHLQALIENEALTQPVLVSKLFLVGDNPAVKLKYVGESFAPQQC